MITQSLCQLGFNEKEAVIFDCLLERGKAPASIISKRTGISRSTVYSILEGLVEKGVVSEERASSNTFYLINGPDSIVRMIEKERESVNKKLKVASRVASIIEPYLKANPAGIPKLQYFQGKRNVENMMFQYLPAWRKSFEVTKDFTVWGIVDERLYDEYKRWVSHRLNQQFSKNKESIKLFSTKKIIEQQKKLNIPNRKIKLLPEDNPIKSTVLIYGDYIIMIWCRERPHFAFQLHSPVFATNLRLTYRLLWQGAD